MFSICSVASVSWCSNSKSIELDGSAATTQGTDALFWGSLLKLYLLMKSPFDSQWTPPPFNSWYLLKTLWQSWDLWELSKVESFCIYRTKMVNFYHIGGLMLTGFTLFVSKWCLLVPHVLCSVSVQYISCRVQFSTYSIWISYNLSAQTRSWSDYLDGKLDWEW